MSLYLVTDQGQKLWVAHETPAGQLYVYVAPTGQFHRNAGLTRDYYADQTLTYTPIATAAAYAEIAAGIGKMDGRLKADQLARYRADTSALDPNKVLGPSPSPPSESPRHRAATKAAELAQAPRGQWVTWQSYPASKAHAAYMAASDLRRGKIRAINTAGPITTRVQTNDQGTLHVQVSRQA